MLFPKRRLLRRDGVAHMVHARAVLIQLGSGARVGQRHLVHLFRLARLATARVDLAFEDALDHRHTLFARLVRAEHVALLVADNPIGLVVLVLALDEVLRDRLGLQVRVYVRDGLSQDTDRAHDLSGFSGLVTLREQRDSHHSFPFSTLSPRLISDANKPLPSALLTGSGPGVGTENWPER